MARFSSVDDAIATDEIGIRIGRHDGLHLKTAYQPVYAHLDGVLVPQAVEALIRPFRDGHPVTPTDFFAGVHAGDRMVVEALCRTLHLRNHRNLDQPHIELFFNYDPRVNGDRDAAIRQLNAMAEHLDADGLDVGLLVCEVTESAIEDRDTFVRLAAEIRRLGMRLAIDDFGAGHSTLERVQTIEPDIVKFDGAFFRSVAALPPALRLMERLVRGFQDGGAHVLVEGIETPAQLAAAIDCGADLVQGFLLGRPQLAGCIFDAAPRPVSRYLEPEKTVVRLRAIA